MTMALILVDLDNVLPDGGVTELVDDCRSVLADHRGIARKCVTSFAFNTDTAIGADLSYEALEAVARGFAEAIGADSHRVEIGLTPTMPQTADVLLARLARRAPDTGGAGSVTFAGLLSKDRDLVAALDEGFVKPKSRWMRAARGWPMNAWRADREGRSIARVAEVAGSAKGETPLGLPEFYTQPVGRAHARWAAARAVDAPPEDLSVLAQLIDEEPWLLSQVGSTKKSLRGVARLLRRGEALGPICVDDGVELRGRAERPTHVSRAEAASVGIGAARFPDERATLACRIPVEVLSHAAEVQLERRGVSVGATLQRLEFERALSSSPVNVRLWATRRGRSPALVAKIQVSSTAQPAIWWITGDRKADSERTVPAAGEWLPAEVLTRGVAYRPDGRTRSRLALRAEVEAGDRVRVENPIAAQTIGQATTIPKHGKPRPVALFAWRHVPVCEVAVEPIHLSPRAPDELTDLPIVVPT
ncbi:MAG: hypothetical protein RLO52_44450 [Sandaracinaceae bacterium]